MSPLIWLAVGGSLLTAGDVVFKLWVNKPHMLLYGGGMVMYMLGAACLVQTYKSQNIAVASAIFIICNLVTLALVSWLFFGEPLTARKLAGMAVAALSILLMS